MINKFLSDFTIFSMNNNCVDILEYMINKYHDEIEETIKYEIITIYNNNIHLEVVNLIAKTYPEIDCFDFDFYYKLVRNNNIVVLKYMFDNFDHD